MGLGPFPFINEPGVVCCTLDPGLEYGPSKGPAIDWHFGELALVYGPVVGLWSLVSGPASVGLWAQGSDMVPALVYGH